MLFNSTVFLMLFLPLALAGWYLLGKCRRPVWSRLFLVGMSLWFYGYYNVSYLWIMVCSLTVNYLISAGMERFSEKCFGSPRFGKNGKFTAGKLLLGTGLFCNLGLLFYFKYFHFFIDNCNFFLHTDIWVEKIALPLGISFFTFQQISYLMDRYRKTAPHYGVVDYSCFITFFPQLVAGPIVLHQEFMPQLQASHGRKWSKEQFLNGAELFILGLAKKVLLADVLALIVNAEYQNLAYLDMLTAWITIICYMLELYFDFSGYCDMARGLGKMFGFELPENFRSPLLAVSVKDFWRRWHITLSRFFMQYVYVPLGGNKKGKRRQCLNLLVVFAASGLWHGANWTFVVWGLLHGLAEIWETCFPKLRFRKEWMNRVTTAVFVTLSFSVFRSESLSDAVLLWKKLFTGGNTGLFLGLCNTLQVPETYAVRKVLELAAPQFLNPVYAGSLCVLLGISLRLICGKRAEQWLERNGKTTRGIFVLATLFVWAFLSLSQVSTFLYFNF